MNRMDRIVIEGDEVGRLNERERILFILHIL